MTATRSIYLASRCSRHPEMRDVRTLLQVMGYTVTSRWIDMCGDGADPEYTTAISTSALEDVEAADTVISFTGEGGKGGRHVEFGIGLALGKRLIIVGPREHIFHTLPQVEHHADQHALITALTPDPWVIQLVATEDGELVGVTKQPETAT